MNVGLNSKRNLPLISNSFGTNDIAYINLAKENSNFILSIPTILSKEGVTNKIGDIVLVYNYLNRSSESMFGKGINLSILRYIWDIYQNENNHVTSVTVLNGDNSFINFTYAGTDSTSNGDILMNSDVDDYLVVEYLYNEEQQIVDVKNIKLYDKYGNYYLYEYPINESNYIQFYYYKIGATDDERIVFTKNLVNNFSICYKGYAVTFYTNNSLLESIVFSINGRRYSYCNISYSNGYLTNIKKYREHLNDEGQTISGLIEDKSYDFNNLNYIIVRNNITNQYTKYYITNEKVTSFRNVLNSDNEDSGKITTISYFDKYTTVTNYKNQVEKYFMEKGRIVSSNFHNGKVSTVNYDNAGRIIENLSFINISKEESIKKGNLFPNGYMFAAGSFSVENKSDNSIVNVIEKSDGTKCLSVCNNSEENEMKVTFEVNGVDIARDSGVTFIANVQSDNLSEEQLKLKIGLSSTNDPSELQNESMYSKNINGHHDTMRAEVARLRGMRFTVIPKLNFSACHDIWLGVYSRMLSAAMRYSSFCGSMRVAVSKYFAASKYQLLARKRTPLR